MTVLEVRLFVFACEFCGFESQPVLCRPGERTLPPGWQKFWDPTSGWPAHCCPRGECRSRYELAIRTRDQASMPE